MIELKNINKVYVNKGNIKHHALKDINLKFDNVGMTFIVGPSGGGKSTLLNIISGLDSFESGSMLIKGVDSKQLNSIAMDSYRNTYGGFIFQEYNLLDHLTLGENVALGVELQERKPSEAEIAEVFKKLGMAGMEKRYPPEISGGQRQRVAIARALLKKPSVLFADEPSGSVDRATRKVIYNILKDLSKEILVVAVTHSTEIASQYADRIITIEDGKIVSDVYYDENSESTLYNKQVMLIKPGKKLGLQEIDELNEVLESNKTKGTYVCLCDSPKKVSENYDKAMTMLKTGEAEKAKKSKANIKDKKKDDNKPFSLITAKLPLKTTAKLSVSNFGANKFRTAFTIILTVLALTLFSISTILSGFNQNKANIECFLDSSAPYMSIEKSSGSFETTDLSKFYSQSGTDYSNNGFQLVHEFGENEKLAELNLNGNETVEVGKYVVFPISPATSTQQYNMFNQKLLYGTWANNGNDIVISNYVAEVIKLQGATGITEGTTIENLIGKTISCTNGSTFNIAGIYDVDWEFCYSIDTETNKMVPKTLTDSYKTKADYIKANVLNVIYVSTDFSVASNPFVYEINGANHNYISKLCGENGSILNFNKNAIDLNIVKDVNMTEDTIKYKITTGTNVANSLTNLIVKNGEYEVYNKEFISTQIVSTTEGADNTIYLCESDYNNLISALTSPVTTVYASSQISEKEFLALSKANCNLTMTSYNSSEIEQFANKFAVVGNGLFVASIILALFAVVMLYSLITQSIRSKYRNIGILRAIGAGMKDIIGIFMLEAFILSVSIILGTLAVSGITTVILNIVVRANTIYALNIFAYNFTVFGIVSGIVLAASFISYLIPMIKIGKTKPFDIIKNNVNN